MFAKCTKNGIKVFVGLNFNERWWKVDYDAHWLLEQMEVGNKVADELVALYKESIRMPCMAGIGFGRWTT